MNPLALLALKLAQSQRQAQDGAGALPQRVASNQLQGPWQPTIPQMGNSATSQYHPMQMQALQKEHEKTMGQAMKLRQKADEYEQNAIALLPKPQVAPTSSRDLLPLAIGSALAALFGAREGDIAQGLGGFIQGREGWANRENENQAAQFKANQNAMMAKAIPLRSQADALEEIGKYQRGRQDKIADDQTDFEQSMLREKAIADRMIGVAQVKADSSNARDLFNANKELFKKAETPAQMQATARLLGADEATIQAFADPTFTGLLKQSQIQLNSVKTEGQILKNEAQKIVNVYLPKTLQGKINLTDAQVEWLNTRIKAYPDYLKLAIAKLGVAEMVANSKIADTEFKQRADVWNAQNKPKIGALESELKEQLKRQADLKKRIAEETDVDADTALSEELSRVNSRIKLINLRIEEIADSVSGLSITPSTTGTTVPNRFGGPLPAVTPGSTLPVQPFVPPSVRKSAPSNTKVEPKGKPKSKAAQETPEQRKARIQREWGRGK